MSESRPIGRPAEFVADDALQSAMALFWERGYDATSLQELESRTGVGRSSLYNAFGGKRDLYLRAVTLYLERLGELMFTPLEAGTGGTGDIHAFFDRLRGGLAAGVGAPPSARGCMLVNGMIEFGGNDRDVAALGEAFSRRFVAAMNLGLDRAAALHEIERDGLEAKARLLLAIALGINVSARAGASAPEIGSLVDAAHGLLRSWRVDDAA